MGDPNKRDSKRTSETRVDCSLGGEWTSGSLILITIAFSVLAAGCTSIDELSDAPPSSLQDSPEDAARTDILEDNLSLPSPPPDARWEPGLDVSDAASGVDTLGHPDSDMDVGADGDTDGNDIQETDDCSVIAVLPLAFTLLDDGFADSEDFIISPSGDYYANHNNALVRRTGGTGPLQVVAAGIGVTAGMAMLPDGDVVAVSVAKGALLRITAAGSVATILSGLAMPNGLTLHSDGTVYISEQAEHRVRAVDPGTGQFTIVAEGLCSPNGLAFGPDYQHLFVASFGCGYVYRLDLLDDGSWDEPYIVGHDGLYPQGATNVFGFGQLDGLEVDTCGNLYVTDYSFGYLWRIPSDLSSAVVAAKLPTQWIPNLHWGNGIGIWQSDVLYVASRHNGNIFAVNVGTPKITGAIP